jgi:hypothetical protein
MTDEVWFGDVLQSWNNGVQLDLRVKLAVDFLKSGVLVAKDCDRMQPGEAATYALDVSTALLNLAAERGLLKDMPDTDQLSGGHRKHIRRMTRAGVLQQVVAQDIARDESPQVAAAPLASIDGRRIS